MDETSEKTISEITESLSHPAPACHEIARLLPLTIPCP
jgi:hypothetical protein